MRKCTSSLIKTCECQPTMISIIWCKRRSLWWQTVGALMVYGNPIQMIKATINATTLEVVTRTRGQPRILTSSLIIMAGKTKWCSKIIFNEKSCLAKTSKTSMQTSQVGLVQANLKVKDVHLFLIESLTLTQNRAEVENYLIALWCLWSNSTINASQIFSRKSSQIHVFRLYVW